MTAKKTRSKRGSSTETVQRRGCIGSLALEEDLTIAYLQALSAPVQQVNEPRFSNRQLRATRDVVQMKIPPGAINHALDI